ncbi:MAG: helix-turn-helix domain-containing protein [SAR202 cluster bacterium]|nr:helix-turn-helix domain-containing protein [SAR202 cluster bacterium]
MTTDSSLAALLRASGLSRDAVGERVGVSTQTVNNWCTRRTRLSPQQLQRLAGVLLAAGARRGDVRAFVLAELRSQGLDLPTMGVPTSLTGPSAHPAETVVILAWRLGPAAHIITQPAEACRATLERLGVGALIVDCGGSHRRKRDYVRAVIDHGFAGAFLLTPGEVPDSQGDLLELVGRLSEAGVASAVFQFWRRQEGLPANAAAFRWDTSATTKLAVELLRGAGHDAIGGVFSVADGIDNSTARHFEAMLGSLNLGERTNRVVFDDGGETVFDEAVQLARRNTAIFADVGAEAALVLRAVTRLGLECPRDVSMVTIGGIPASLVPSSQPLTTIDLPLSEMGRDAGTTLHRLIAGEALRDEERYRLYGARNMSVTHATGGTVAPPRTLARGHA